jgi:hypothetical protein
MWRQYKHLFMLLQTILMSRKKFESCRNNRFFFLPCCLLLLTPTETGGASNGVCGWFVPPITFGWPLIVLYRRSNLIWATNHKKHFGHRMGTAALSTLQWPSITFCIRSSLFFPPRYDTLKDSIVVLWWCAFHGRLASRCVKVRERDIMSHEMRRWGWPGVFGFLLLADYKVVSRRPWNHFLTPSPDFIETRLLVGLP